MNQEHYRRRLGQRLDSMRDAWREWLDGDADSRQQLITHSHQLGGSAALYGYAELGECANCLHAAIKRRLPFTEVRDCWRELQVMLESILLQDKSD